MKTVADLKKRLIVGTKIVLLDFKVNGAKTPHKYLKIPRTINIVQSNSFAMNNSWVNWPKKKEFFPTSKDSFELHQGDVILSYEILN